jgi:hypothetical protein
MRPHWTWVPLPRHTAKAGEIVQVLWSDYYGATMFGDEEEIVCLPHKGCRLEIIAAVATSHYEVNLLLPGQVVRYKGSFWFLDRFELPSGTGVGLWHLVGFKLRLVPDAIGPVPSEDEILNRVRGRPERVTVS